MNFNDLFSIKTLEDYSLYVEELFNTIITKVNEGKKRIMFVLPTGGGKTTLLCRVAKTICCGDNDSAVFVVGFRVLAEQLKLTIGKDLPSAHFLTFSDLKNGNFSLLNNASAIFVDDLRIMDRRELMDVLKNNSSVVVSACSLASQETI